MADGIPDIYGSEIYDVPRQKSACKVIVYSHIQSNPDDRDYKGRVDCSRDVIQCNTSKTIKSGGGASFVLVPRRNYLNYIYPNDYVHVYFDPGDGRGFIRVFFGFVDRIERTIKTDNRGATMTQFHVSCSDFTKAFDKTHIYFNPHVANRGDFVSAFFKGRPDGANLRSKGVSIQGTPADIVTSLATLIMGFGEQFAVPQSYPKNEAYIDHSRKARLRNIMGGLQSEYQDLIGKNELAEMKATVEAEWQAIAGKTVDKILGQPLPAVLSGAGGVGVQAALRSAYLGTELLNRESLEAAASLEALQAEEVNSNRYNQALAAQRQAYNTKMNLLDLIDFSFVEYGAIDGSILATQIWQSQGPLWSIMNAWANGMVNELFCDLRPVTANKNWDLAEGPYSKSPDESKENTGGGVRMAPAIVMREYPFSTISGYQQKGVKLLGFRELGWVPFCGRGSKPPLWSRDVNIPGRKVNNIVTLNPFRFVESKGKERGMKHLDVAVIGVQDIISETIGRSDADVVNLIEVYSDIGIGASIKYMSSTVQPIANPISVKRNGLRVRRYDTKFARWPANRVAKGVGGIETMMARYQCVRWVLLLDHWYQHNNEYLNGNITTRAFPEIRVGYRLDIRERRESYYVEGANHNWAYNEKGSMLTSTFTLSRGQRNDPFPVYVKPALPDWGGVFNRDDDSRLGQYFGQRNPSAVVRSSVLGAFTDDGVAPDDGSYGNLTDIPQGQPWASTRGFMSAGAGGVAPIEEEDGLSEAERTQKTAKIDW